MSDARTLSEVTYVPDIRYDRPDGVDLRLDIVAPAPLPTDPLPAVVRIDGCPGWGPGDRSSALLPFANPALARAGFLTIAVSVRHSRQARFPAQLHDVQAALRWLRRNPLGLPVNPDSVGVWGHSAGGHLAAIAGLKPSTAGRGHRTAALRDDVQAVVTISGPSDLARSGGAMRIDRPSPVTALVGGDISTHLDELRAASPITHVSAAAPPFLNIHGTSDETVPYEQAELLWSALLASGTEAHLLPIAHGHHNLQRDPHRRYGGQVWDYVASEAATFFNRHLRPHDGDHPRPR